MANAQFNLAMLLHAEELATERDGAVAADVSTGAGDDGMWFRFN